MCFIIMCIMGLLFLGCFNPIVAFHLIVILAVIFIIAGIGRIAK